MGRLIRMFVVATLVLLLVSCASSSVIENQNASLSADEVIVLARIKVIYEKCNHCEYRANPQTGELEVAHPELPAWSVVTDPYPGRLVVASGDPLPEQRVYLSRPIIEAGEVFIDMKNGNSVVAVRLKKGETYHLGRYFRVPFEGLTYMFKDKLSINTPTDGMVYVGDIILDISARVGGGPIWTPGSSMVYGGLEARVLDNETETVGELKQKYPTLFQKYRYQKLLAL